MWLFTFLNQSFCMYVISVSSIGSFMETEGRFRPLNNISNNSKINNDIQNTFSMIKYL